MKKFYIFTNLELDQRNFERFDIKILLNFFDKIEIFHINRGYNFVLDGIFINEKIKLHRINNIFQTRKLLNVEKNSIYIDISVPNFKTIVCKTILYVKKCKGIIYELGNIPSYKKKVKEDINFSLKKLIRFFNTKIFNFLNNRFYKKKNIYLCAGKIKQKEYKNLKFIKTHSFDYNEKIKCKKKLINEKKFFLYLDQYEHDHPDYNYNEVRKINAKDFYKSLNIFFDRLEQKFKKKVIIAAHPRSKKHSYFEGRKIIFNKTNELTKNCYATISHDSTAISFSIIYKKPIIFIINNEMIRVDKHKENKIKVFTSELGFSLFNIDEINNFQDLGRCLKKLNKKKYNNYFLNYIKDIRSNKKKIGEIICDIYSNELSN